MIKMTYKTLWYMKRFWGGPTKKCSSVKNFPKMLPMPQWGWGSSSRKTNVGWCFVRIVCLFKVNQSLNKSYSMSESRFKRRTWLFRAISDSHLNSKPSEQALLKVYLFHHINMSNMISNKLSIFLCFIRSLPGRTRNTEVCHVIYG